MSLQDYQKRYRAIVGLAAQIAEKEVKENANRGIFERFHLYYRAPTETEDGMLRLFSNSIQPPSEWKPAGASPLGIDIPYANYFTWIHTRCSSLPLLATSY